MATLRGVKGLAARALRHSSGAWAPSVRHTASAAVPKVAAAAAAGGGGSSGAQALPLHDRLHAPSTAALALASGVLGVSLWATTAPSSSPDQCPQAEAARLPGATAPAAPASATATAAAEDLGGRLVPKMKHPLKIYVGYDKREDIAFQVCRQSILKHATVPVEVIPIKQDELRNSGVYTRARDSTESTEFSFTRFLTPYLANYEGWAMFVDCDFLYTGDIKELFDLCDDRYAAMCVQHDYRPKTTVKMDGVVQTSYPRKNWSSMVLYNCSHPKNRTITPDVVNSQSGAFLHRFQWLSDAEIGSVPHTWNFLVGHNEAPVDGQPPRAIHYTLGGPWFEEYKNCEYGDLWDKEKAEFESTEAIRKIIAQGLIAAIEEQVDKRFKNLESMVQEVAKGQAKNAATQRAILDQMESSKTSPKISVGA